MISAKLKQTPVKELGYVNKSSPTSSTKKNKPSFAKKISKEKPSPFERITRRKQKEQLAKKGQRSRVMKEMKNKYVGKRRCMEDIDHETSTMVEDTPIGDFTPSKKDQIDKTQEIKRLSPRYTHKKNEKQTDSHEIGTPIMETSITESNSSVSI